MEENITKIKVGDDVRCISLDTEVINTTTLCFFGTDGRYTGKLSVKLGSSVYADEDNNGIGVKIHPDTRNYLQPNPSGLTLMLDTMANDMAGAVSKRLGLVIDGYSNELRVGTAPLKLGTGLIGGDSGHALCLSLGSGLMFDRFENKIRLKIDDVQGLIVVPSDGPITFDLGVLYSLLEGRYNLTKK